MSESNNGRPRRRAARSAGPPVEDVQFVDVTVDAVAAASAEVVDVEVAGADEAPVVAAPVELTKAAVVDEEVDDDSA